MDSNQFKYNRDETLRKRCQSAKDMFCTTQNIFDTQSVLKISRDQINESLKNINQCLNQTFSQSNRKQQYQQQQQKEKDSLIHKWNQFNSYSLGILDLNIYCEDQQYERQNMINSIEVSLKQKQKADELDTFEKYFYDQNKNIKIHHRIRNHQQNIIDILKQKQYYLGKYLKSGGEGHIFEGYMRKTNSSDQIHLIFKIQFKSNEEDIKEEIEIMKMLETSVNVIQMMEYIKHNNFIIFVLEKCVHSLSDELEKINKKEIKFTIKNLVKVIFDLLDGLIQLKTHNVVHLDIKPGNILLTSNGDLKYADFGCSSVVQKDKIIQYKGHTETYAPQEQINQTKDMNFKTDVYALGKTFLDIINVYEKANQFNNHYQTQNLKSIIYNKMIKEHNQEREDCLNLPQLFYQEIFPNQNFEVTLEFIQNYSKKISFILDLLNLDSNENNVSEIKNKYQEIQKDILSIKNNYLAFTQSQNESYAEHFDGVF